MAQGKVRTVTVADVWDESLSVPNAATCRIAFRYGTYEKPKRIIWKMTASEVEWLAEKLIDVAEQMAAQANGHLASIRERAARRPA